MAPVRVHLRVGKPDGYVSVNLRPDGGGRVLLAWPEGVVVRLAVILSEMDGDREVVVAENDEGLDLVGGDEIVLEELCLLLVRTVDPWRAPRPEERELTIHVTPLVHVEGQVLEEADGAIRPSRRLGYLQVIPQDLPAAFRQENRCGEHFSLDLLPGRWRLVLTTAEGRGVMTRDLGDVQADWQDVVLFLRWRRTPGVARCGTAAEPVGTTRRAVAYRR